MWIVLHGVWIVLHPSLELAIRIADYFGVTVDQLARDELEVG